MGVLRGEGYILITSPNDRKVKMIRHRDRMDSQVNVELSSPVILRQALGCRHVVLRPRRTRDVRVNNNVRREDDGENATIDVIVRALEPSWYDPQGVNPRQEGGTMMTAWRG